jgi:hypothetical protein
MDHGAPDGPIEVIYPEKDNYSRSGQRRVTESFPSLGQGKWKAKLTHYLFSKDPSCVQGVNDRFLWLLQEGAIVLTGPSKAVPSSPTL